MKSAKAMCIITTLAMLTMVIGFLPHQTSVRSSFQASQVRLKARNSNASSARHDPNRHNPVNARERMRARSEHTNNANGRSKTSSSTTIKRNDANLIRFKESIEVNGMKDNNSNPVDVREKMRARWTQSDVNLRKISSTQQSILMKRLRDKALHPNDARERMRARQAQSNVRSRESTSIQPLEYTNMVDKTLHPVDARERMRAKRVQSGAGPQEGGVTQSSSDISPEQFESETRLPVESGGLQVEQEIVEAAVEEIQDPDSEESTISSRNANESTPNDKTETGKVVSSEKTPSSQEYLAKI